MEQTYIGVDVGNYDTKTALSSTPSGYSKSEDKPFGVKECIFYNGMYYAPSERRFPYTKDKTKDERAFILSLFGIAKEIIEVCKRKDDQNEKQDNYQDEISKIDVVNLCVGLPPAHMHMLKDKTISYYKEMFGDGIEFNYNQYTFKLKLNLLLVVPQDYAALSCVIGKKNDKTIPNVYKEYYAIDIGGATVDVVPIRNNVPIVDECISLELGVLLMYDKIQNQVEEKFGISISQNNIEDVLREEPTIIDDEVVDGVKEGAAGWFENIINILNQRGIPFRTSPVVFVGGGAKLFKTAIEKNTVIKKYEFFGNANANAIGYKKFVERMAKKAS